MALLLQVDRVLYQCSCGSDFPLCRLYFCRYCICLRCANCTQHEADVFYCPQCLQSHMAPEAKLHHLRCRTCFECPSCSATLTMRAVTATTDAEVAPSEGDDPNSKKKYYLACGYCHWTTRESGHQERELSALHDSFYENNGHKSEVLRIKQLKESYQLISLRDASERAIKRAGLPGVRRKNLTTIALKQEDPSHALLASRLSTPPGVANRAKQMMAATISADSVLEKVRANPKAEVEALPDSFFQEQVNLQSVTSVEQRLADIQLQPTSCYDFRPIRKRLAIKKSIRCKQCDHSLCKPEFSTSNIKFKIQLLALLQIPELRIHPGYQLLPGKICEVVFSLSNPDLLQPCTFKLTADNDSKSSTAKVNVPEVEFQLEPKNEAFQLDDTAEIEASQKSYIAFNNGCKIGIKCSVEVPEAAVPIKVSLVMHHSPLVSSSASQEGPMQFPIIINLGTAA